MGLLSDIFTWWNGQTFGTRLFTARNGVKVGEDELGNVYYQTQDGARRWVIYAQESEASRVPAEWHGWLHHTFAKPPTEEPLPRKTWEKPHQPNMTGLAGAYAPPGSITTPATRAKATGDYEAWAPE